MRFVTHADAYVAGYTILVDWSARDVQFAEMQVRLGPTKGKDTATTLGPVLVTPDELQPWRTDTSFDLTMTVEINGERLGQDRWSSMAFSYADMIAYASPGTEIRPGDVVTVTVEQLGTLTTRVVPGVEPIPIPPARRGR
ncbi:fumarylacetoacetate hydrolase family protein [Nonomuraea rubra]|uniref:2-keto-4-pentenoate hydratase/2-oxohepta-3-ene-1,7-dioic acid hydratase in catechol pathway n=1 Tax=Nonomuraea rubra TaxID=46180 RepID=A0A7X0NVK4_9ACTN|nr:fumarylacetoacetate hydrolase family protein [Nonomuraea rubra]MBB6550206.1 2-keto-4-pentenoate hydratase/2-oxohepta-3-ene-1,7-dioic acid hydratase in catechol pathway [Nonomuraea rubra]